MINLSKTLINNLNDNDIPYCHWKSNIGLEKELRGGELDLHIKIEFKNKFESLITTLGFVKIITPLQSHMPGVYHYFGFDETSGKLLHLHIFYKILTGESILKNYKLPISDLLINESYKYKNVFVPRIEIEYCLFVIRTFAKYNSLFEYLLILREKEKVKKESFFIDNQELDESFLKSILKSHFNNIPYDYVKKGMELIKNEASFFSKFHHSRKINKYFKKNIRYNFISAKAFRLFIFLKLFSCKYIYRRKFKILSKTGFIFAISGAEATGKSTLIRELKHWLSNEFYLKQFHMGKPVSTLITLPFNLVNPILRKIYKNNTYTHMFKNENTTNAKQLSFMFSFRSVLLAYDRYRMFKKVQKKSLNGAIVLCDRWPSLKLGAMDSPRILITQSDSFYSRVILFFSKLELYFYKKIKNPDCIVQLELSKDIAVSRNKSRNKKNKESSRYVLKRHSENAKPDYNDANSCTLNTDDNIENSILEIKRIFWKNVTESNKRKKS